MLTVVWWIVFIVLAIHFVVNLIFLTWTWILKEYDKDNFKLFSYSQLASCGLLLAAIAVKTII